MPRKITGTINRTYDLASSMSVNEKTYNKDSQLNTWFKMTENIFASGDLIDSVRGVGLTPSNDAGFRRPPYTTSIIPDKIAGVTAISLDSSYVFPIGAAGSEVVLEQKSTDVDEFDYGHNPPGPNNAFTFGFWIRFASTNADRTILSKWHDNDTNQQQYQIRINGGQQRIQFRVYHNPSSRIYQIQSSAQLDAARWYHIAFTFSGNASKADSLKIYIDGKLDKSDRLRDSGNNPHPDGSIFNKSSFFAIGNDYVNYYPDRALEGIISELAIWTTELGEEDLYVIYNMLSLDDASKFRSGYVNLPPRIEIRNRDNATGSYPTILRMGDKDRRGSYSTQFDDTNTILFGRRIRDNFELKEEDKESGILGYTKKINTRDWTQSGDLEIRRELISSSGGSTAKDGALVLAGAGDGSGHRWIQTREKIKNPVLEAEVIFGPYNEQRTVLKHGLGLKSPGSTEDRGLKIQVSTSGSPGTWTTIKTLTGDVESLFVLSSFSSRSAFEALLQKRKRTKIKLTPSDFSGVAGSEFYLRFAQESVSDPNQVEWAIGYVNIDYHKEDVRYPLMIDPASRVGQRIATGAIATPHELPTLTAPGRSISGISDVHLKFTPGEGISAFDDSRINIVPENFFFQQGSDPEEVRGLSSPLWSKTQFVVDLSPNEETTFGLTSRSTQPAAALEQDDTIKQQIMVYWNAVDKKWEKIAQGISANAPGKINTSLENMISSGALGFSGIDIISTGSTFEGAESTQEVFSSDILKSFARPTSTFGFPFEGKYHATSSQAIRASDLGITKPFVLEKCQIIFDSKFEFADHDDQGRNAFSSYLSYGAPSNKYLSQAQKILIPTFFMLRQQDYDNFSVNIEYKDEPYTSPVYIENNRIVSIPSSDIRLSTENEALSQVNTSREMITYGQPTLFVSSSTATSYFNMRQALDQGLSRDLEIDVLSINGQNSQYNPDLNESIEPITGSFVMNFPCRMTSKIPGGSRITVENSTSLYTGLFLNNTIGGRSYGNLDSSARSIINGTSTLYSKGTYLISATGASQPLREVELPSGESADLYSPYIIMPNDILVFGWQYPVPLDTQTTLPGSGDTRLNSMTLFGNSKLTLFGSQLKDDIEFHETNNQNLGSDAAHELIGSEPVVDQFELSRAIENFGNYLDNYVATSTEEPVKRVLSSVQSRLTTEKGLSQSATGYIEIPGLTSFVPFGKRAGLNDGDLIVIKDAVGTIVHFYAFRHRPFGPAERIAGNLPTYKDLDGDGSINTPASPSADDADTRVWFDPALPDPTSQIFNHTDDSFSSIGYGLTWATSGGPYPNSYPGQGGGFDGNTFNNFQPPGTSPGTYDPPNQVYSFRIDGGVYNGGISFSSVEKVNTMNNLLTAIQASALRVVGNVTTTVLSNDVRLNLTLLDGGTSGQHQIKIIPALSLYSQLDDTYYSKSYGFTGANDLLDSSLGSFVRISPTRDATRVYSDSLLSGSIIDTPLGGQYSNFGTMQTGGSEIRPKYYLDSRKFGQSVHFLEQGKDSKSDFNLKTRRSGLLNTLKGEPLDAPVRVEFVSGSTSDSTATRRFRRSSASQTTAVNKSINSVLTGAFFEM